MRETESVAFTEKQNQYLSKNVQCYRNCMKGTKTWIQN